MRVVATLLATTALLAGGPGPLAAQDSGEGLEEAIERAESYSADEFAVDDFAEEELLTDEELDELVAPVALYPDALLAQVLVAATYPLDVVKAERFLEENADLSEDELVDEVEAQDWDLSVQVLAGGFPTVVERMSDEIEWTEELGIAMLSQDEDVLAAVQRMRRLAEDTGYLTSNDAQLVSREGDQITITPADPEIIYVPTYDSTAAFTSAPSQPPVIVAPPENRFSATNPLVTGAIGFGAGYLVNELLFGDDDDDGGDDDDEDWRGYWRDSRPIDWRDRAFYPRPSRYWARETRRDARRDELREARWEAEDERLRAARRWRELRRDFREDRPERVERREELREELREERQERRQERREEARDELRQERRGERREEARQEQGQEERREDAQRQEERREEARREQRQEERREAAQREERRQAAQEEERRQAAQQEERQATQQEERRQAARQQERREQARRQQAQQEQRRQQQRAEQEQQQGGGDGERRRCPDGTSRAEARELNCRR